MWYDVAYSLYVLQFIACICSCCQGHGGGGGPNPPPPTARTTTLPGIYANLLISQNNVELYTSKHRITSVPVYTHDIYMVFSMYRAINVAYSLYVFMVYSLYMFLLQYIV